MSRATHTNAVLSVSAETFHEIKKGLIEAGYHHAFDTEPEYGETIEMRGIMLAGRKAENATISTSSLYGKTGPGVELLKDGRLVFQTDVRKAKEIGMGLIEAAEAAISDAAFVAFLRGLGIIEPGAVAGALRTLREIRQGDREAVNPS